MEWKRTRREPTISKWESGDGQWMIYNFHTDYRFGWNWKLHQLDGDHWRFVLSCKTLKDAKRLAETGLE